LRRYVDLVNQWQIIAAAPWPHRPWPRRSPKTCSFDHSAFASAYAVQRLPADRTLLDARWQNNATELDAV
jgi:hypothetical protein